MILTKELLLCFLFLHLHWAVFAGAAFMANKILHLKDETFRKMLHLVSVFAIIPITLPATSPLPAIAVCMIFMTEAWFGAKKAVWKKIWE